MKTNSIRTPRERGANSKTEYYFDFISTVTNLTHVELKSIKAFEPIVELTEKNGDYFLKMIPILRKKRS